MKILVLAEDYSTTDGLVSLHYIHSRNKWYIEKNLDVSVISFRTKNDYKIDGVKVYTIKSYKEKLMSQDFDLVLSHAPNIKHHLKFLNKYGDKFNNIIFYFHGHEVLRTSKIYPKPYKFTKKQPFIKKLIREVYDSFKLLVWKNEIPKFIWKSQFIFVSNWMYNMFIRFVKINPELIKDRKHIIYNCIGKEFQNITYDTQIKKKYDFITIRNNLDGSKYGIDIVTKIAKNNPKYKFCVIGKGKFYRNFEKPENLEWIDKNLTHEEIIDFLNRSRCALIPTRADAQGVMACEMATFGIPLITSNIDVCKEVFEGFENVAFIDNEDEKINIEPILKELQKVTVKQKNEKYFEKNTVVREIELFKKLKG
ncbi:MAG: glycosyltransferase family 4 protein [Clostridiaceae bacterium]|nr:glycosyltransferase family 4 protein [Clostridiaceae bacterium]